MATKLSAAIRNVICPGLAAMVLLAGCAGEQAIRASDDGTILPSSTATTAFAAPSIDQLWPISTDYYRTTSSDIYLGNVNARITTLQSRVDAGHRERAEALAGQLYHRYKLLGNLGDADRATALLAERASVNWLTPSGMVLYSITLSGLHRFDEADSWLQRAKAAGAAPEEWRDVAADILVARGDYRALSAEFSTSSEPVADFYALAHRADLRLLKGDLKGAEQHFLAAQTQYRDSNPVPLAWLHTQMGIGYLRFGKIKDAKRFFSAAVERLPGYYLAEEHLAECEVLLGDLPGARARYQRVIEQTGNPEFIAALSSLERTAGNAELADTLAQQAKAGYEDLLNRLPAAYAQHAAQFFIETGDATRGYALAQENARLRSDVGSLILLATAAHAAQQPEAACEARARAMETGLQPPEIRELDALATLCTASDS